LSVVPRDEQLDPAPGHAPAALAFRFDLEPLVLARAVDAVLGLEFALGRRIELGRLGRPSAVAGVASRARS
jgi:hypothetical protein